MPTAIYYPPLQDGLQKTLDASLLTGVTASATFNNVTSIQNKLGLFVVDRLDGNNVLTPNKREYISFAGTSGSTVVTLVRGLAGSTDQDHAVGAIVEFVNDVVQQQAIIDGLLLTVTTAGVLNSATGAEVNTGTDPNKIVTPKAIADSNNVPSVVPGTSGNIMESNGTDWISVAPLTVGWTDVSSFANSWVNYGTPAPNVGYCRDIMGIVSFRGGLKSGTIGAAAFTLPVGSRPTGTLFFSVFCFNGSTQIVARISIASDGTVTPDIGHNSHMSLDGVSFRI